MIILEYEQVELDFCARCRGVWLDAGELELLLGGNTPVRGFMTAGGKAGASKEKPRRCPICRKKMAKEVTGGPRPVTYDRCLRGDGIWFDRGELLTVIRYGSASPDTETVVAWLRDMFPEEADRENE